jgi:transposase
MSPDSSVCLALLKEGGMTETYLVAIDLGKRHFQVCATDETGKTLFNRAFSRQKLQEFLDKLPSCIVAMEACATSHHWGRIGLAAGHEVRLIPPIYVKPFVKRQKNDAADAEAIAEAARRPNLQFVAVKSAEHQARAVTFRTHQCFVKQRTQLINALRGHLAEFGVIAPGGATNVKQLEQAIREECTDLPAVVREMARFYLEQIEALTIRIDGLVQQLQLASRTDSFLRRLCTVPGVGPVTAGAIAAFAPDLRTFSNGRNFAAWLGLVPIAGHPARAGRSTDGVGGKDFNVQMERSSPGARASQLSEPMWAPSFEQHTGPWPDQATLRGLTHGPIELPACRAVSEDFSCLTGGHPHTPRVCRRPHHLRERGPHDEASITQIRP